MVASRFQISFLFGFFLIISNLISLFSTETIKNVSKNKTLKLTTIEDVEMLTYFLLWKHDYFDSFPEFNQGLFSYCFLYKYRTFYMNFLFV